MVHICLFSDCGSPHHLPFTFIEYNQTTVGSNAVYRYISMNFFTASNYVCDSIMLINLISLEDQSWLVYNPVMIAYLYVYTNNERGDAGQI